MHLEFKCKKCGGSRVRGEQLAVVSFLVLEISEEGDMQIDQVEIVSDEGPIHLTCAGCSMAITEADSPEDHAKSKDWCDGCGSSREAHEGNPDICGSCGGEKGVVGCRPPHHLRLSLF